jgi:hypothetical protein
VIWLFDRKASFKAVKISNNLCIPQSDPRLSTKSKKLTVGVLLDSVNIPAWQFHLLSAIQLGNFAQTAYVNISGAAKSGSIKKPIGRKAIELLHRQLLPPKKGIANAGVLLDARPVLETTQVNFSGKPNFGAFDAVDIYLHLSASPPQRADSVDAKVGLWYCCGADQTALQTDKAGLNEYAQGIPVTEVSLVCLAANATAPQLVGKTNHSTQIWSWQENSHMLLWQAAGLVERELSRLAQLGSAAFFSCKAGSNAEFSAASQNDFVRSYSSIDLLKLLVKKIALNAMRIAKKLLFKSDWVVLIRQPQNPEVDQAQYTVLLAPKGVYWADPFPFEQASKKVVFVEEFVHRLNKGRICALEIDNQGRIVNRSIVLELATHLSYPFVFEYKNELFMLPESGASGAISVYRCIEFPHRWEVYKTLISNVAAYDSTLFFYKGKYWLFTSSKNALSQNTWGDVYLFYADSPLSENWTAHPMNPIVSDVANARPAGNIFFENGQMFRPAQSSTYCYGYGFNINRIDVLNESEYSEVCVKQYRPRRDSSIEATHTRNTSPSTSVIDARCRSLRFFAQPQAISLTDIVSTDPNFDLPLQ